jgi:hypothetical protein
MRLSDVYLVSLKARFDATKVCYLSVCEQAILDPHLYFTPLLLDWLMRSQGGS